MTRTEALAYEAHALGLLQAAVLLKLSDLAGRLGRHEAETAYINEAESVLGVLARNPLTRSTTTQNDASSDVVGV